MSMFVRNGPNVYQKCNPVEIEWEIVKVRSQFDGDVKRKTQNIYIMVNVWEDPTPLFGLWLL